jgi:hypothetical protein
MSLPSRCTCQPYGDDVPEQDLGRLRDAYATAWTARQESGDTSPALLAEALAASELDVFNRPGPGRDLMLTLWERGVPPEALERELRRALPGMAWTTARSFAKSAVEIIKLFGEGGWERIDSTWQDMPECHRRLSEARKANDLVLRWLHAPVDKVPLDLRVDADAAAVMERCREVPSPNRKGWAEACCWLVPEASPDVRVMVGKERIGWSTVSHPVWHALKREEQRRIYADGSVFLDHYGPQIDLVCYLPRAD